MGITKFGALKSYWSKVIKEKQKKNRKNNGEFTKNFKKCNNQYISVFRKIQNWNQRKKLCKVN